MTQTRRRFLGRTVGVMSGITVLPFLARNANAFHDRYSIDHGASLVLDPEARPLLDVAVTAATQAGAVYADVRMTHTWDRRYEYNGRRVTDEESMTVGVRALYDGYWGFASGPVWTKAEMARLGKEAAGQAKANALAKTSNVHLARIAPVNGGKWIMPVERDPFTVHPAEVRDLLEGVHEYAKRIPPSIGSSIDVLFKRQDKIFASSEGSFFSQRTFRTTPLGWVIYQVNRRRSHIAFESLTMQGAGFEALNEQQLRDEIPILLDRVQADAKLQLKAVDVGRYATVVDTDVMAQLIGHSVGVASELDRALGFEANASGTSYLIDPEEMLGTFKVGNTLLNVNANRSDVGGVATVAWDDEGVTPKSYPLVAAGKFVDCHTTRESSGWLQSWYERNGRAVESNGCAYAPAGVDCVLTHTPNLSVAPGEATNNFDSLLETIEDGFAFRRVQVSMDFQQSGGMTIPTGSCYEVKRGKKTARVVGAGIMFRTPELWNSLKVLGGVDASRMRGVLTQKGQPPQTGAFSVTTPPALFDQLTIVDINRKA